MRKTTLILFFYKFTNKFFKVLQHYNIFILQTLIIYCQQLYLISKTIHSKQKKVMGYSRQGQDNGDLIYDNTAFCHFMVSISVLTVIILILMIIKQLWERRMPNLYSKLAKQQIFQNKVINSCKFYKISHSNKSLSFKTAFLILLLFTFYFYYSNIEMNGQLVGFDPYEILNLQMGANQTQIKKSYRKLALQYHPDRNLNDGEAYKKFILISKAYKCLTDQSTRINCQKYGHPDGETSYQIGIGLPEFMVNGDKSLFTIIILLLILLVIIPSIFFTWSSQKKTKKLDHSSANKIIKSLMNPKLNTIGCCIMYGCMRELNYLFKSNELLQKQSQINFRSFLLQSSSISEKDLNKISSHQLFKIKCLYDFINGNNNEERIVYQMPKICERLIKISFNYAKRSLNKQDEVRQWYGLLITKRIISFSQQIFNRIPSNLSQTDQEENQKDVFQPNHLPRMNICSSITVEDKQVQEMTIDDVGFLHLKIERQKSSPGIVVCKDFPFITQQRFILLIFQNSNLLSSLIFNFESQFNQIVHSFRLKKLKKGKSNIQISLYSTAYPTIVLQREVNFYVYQRLYKKQIQIHQQDQKLDQIPKNFFEKLISVNDDSMSDLQLSDSEEQIKQQKKPKKKKEKITEKKSRKLHKIIKQLQFED